MVTGSSLLALAISAVGAGSGPGDEPISCQIRILTMNGLEWRSAYYSRLQPVARQGTSAIWTADRALGEKMTAEALTSTVTPVCTNPGETKVDFQAKTHYVGHEERVADGPINQATAVAWKPEVAVVEEGFHAVVSGRKLDQGVLSRIRIEESHIKAMHFVNVTETVRKLDGPAAYSKLTTGEILNQFFQNVSLKLTGEFRVIGIRGDGDALSKVEMVETLGEPGQKITVQHSIPEISHARVEGEWLIPKDGVLLVSLGVDTVAEPNGKAAVRERIAVIEVEPAPAGMAMTHPHFEGGHPWLSPDFRPKKPPVPSRSMPIAVNPQGQVVDLPPLPEAMASADLNQIHPEPYQPSPQSVHVSTGSADVQVARTGLETPRPEFGTSDLTKPGLFVRLPSPPLPARTTPEAIDKDGQVIDLPPLPEALASADLNLVNPDKPSGQSRHIVSEPIRDADLARTSHEFGVPDVSSNAIYRPLMVRLAEVLASVLEESCEDEGKFFVTATPAEFDIQVLNENDQATCSKADREKGSNTPLSAPARMALGLTIDDSAGSKVLDSSTSLETALKNPGKTETRYLKIGDKFSLEIRATVVPTGPGMYNKEKKDESPAEKP
ncbi:hypothetical protein P12x_003812 [Tundrisphaera lichenicola]|uniref:hypothetical protein n=1 Tax=Tundrisphaera lichenicola TaxID=2029860 RepID=UPI003EB6D9E2